jgi:aromatic-L-amino-acid/L-tryptophan decarboxylase
VNGVSVTLPLLNDATTIPPLFCVALSGIVLQNGTMRQSERDESNGRRSPLEMSPGAFRSAGHQLVEDLSRFLESLPVGKVTSAPSVSELQSLLGRDGLPQAGRDASALLREATGVLTQHSLFNGHPRFWGYVTSSAAPIGALADFLAAAMNQNVGAWQLSPLASEIEAQTVRWIAEFVGYPTDCGGLMVSGGNMANFIGFLAGRRSRIPWDIRKEGLQNRREPLCVYCSDAAHTWVQKAADLFGLGTDALRWIACDGSHRLDVSRLAEQIAADRQEGRLPLMVLATAGSVGTGSVDPINDIADVCGREGLWLHVDGAYGAMAAAIPEAEPDLKALHRADSLALDPHKWLYSPLEAGCALVRNPRDLPDTFSFHPDYYKFDLKGEQPPTNYYELGMQNSRGFRALKVWLAFRQVGAPAFIEMIRDDIRLARAMMEAVATHPDLEARTCHLSITTFRFVPEDLRNSAEEQQTYLNNLNEAILEQIQKEGEIFVSNAVLQGDFVLRACIVNFRTTMRDVQLLPGIVARWGRALDRRLRPPNPDSSRSGPPTRPSTSSTR